MADLFGVDLGHPLARPVLQALGQSDHQREAVVGPDDELGQRPGPARVGAHHGDVDGVPGGFELVGAEQGQVVGEVLGQPGMAPLIPERVDDAGVVRRRPQGGLVAGPGQVHRHGRAHRPRAEHRDPGHGWAG